MPWTGGKDAADRDNDKLADFEKRANKNDNEQMNLLDVSLPKNFDLEFCGLFLSGEESFFCVGKCVTARKLNRKGFWASRCMRNRHRVICVHIISTIARVETHN